MNFLKNILAALAATIAMSASAQNEVKPFEVEVKVGATYPTQKYFGDKQVGPSLGLEGRWNLSQLPEQAVCNNQLTILISLSTPINERDYNK